MKSARFGREHAFVCRRWKGRVGREQLGCLLEGTTVRRVRIFSLVAAAALVGVLGCSRKPVPETRTLGDSTIQKQSAKTSIPRAITVATAPNVCPKGYRSMLVGGVAPAPGGSAVVLVDTPGDIAVPIFIGGAEAMSIQLRLDGRTFKRPLTHDLVDSVLARLGGEVLSVRVDRVEDEIFYGTLVLKNGGKQVELDSRPSDAIALAVGSNAPIYVAQAVIDSTGMRLDELDDDDEEFDDDFEEIDDGPTRVSL